MSRQKTVPDFERMQAFVVALAESKALAEPRTRAKTLPTRAMVDPSKLSERASVAIASARAEQKRYRAVFDALVLPCLLSDRAGQVRMINKSARTMFGLDDVAILRRPIHRLFDPSAAIQLGRAIERIERETTALRLRLPFPAERQGQEYVEVHAVCIGKKDVLWTLSPEASERESVLSRKLADKDEVIAHQRTKIESLERESRTKDKFIAVLGHDLRAPLNAVLGWTQLMRREPLDAVGRDRALLTIERNARSQAALIEELLDVTRMNEGKLALEISACDVGRIVRRAIEAALPDAARRGVELTARIEVEATVAGDRGRLEQIVTNLVSNALKFTSSGGSVQVLVSRDRGYVRVDVRDTGKGISPELLPHVFKWLRQGGDAPPTREGLGLGLFIVRRLTELHGGSVQAKSDGENHGATFTVLLPCCNAESGIPSPNSEILPELGELDGIDVLVVEDETDAVELLSRVLVARGARVMSARDATSALAIAIPKRPEVIVTDLGLPDMDGYELVRRIRAEHGGSVGIVALTGFAAKDCECPQSTGFDERLTKPVDISRLIRAIQHASNAARTRSERRERMLRADAEEVGPPSLDDLRSFHG